MVRKYQQAQMHANRPVKVIFYPIRAKLAQLQDEKSLSNFHDAGEAMETYDGTERLNGTEKQHGRKTVPKPRPGDTAAVRRRG